MRLLQRDNAAEHPKHRLPYRILGVDIADLRQIPELQALVHVHGAAVGLLLAGEDAHQRGLAAAVGADKAHFFAFLHGKSNVAQHLVDAEALLHIFHGNQDHERYPLIGLASQRKVYHKCGARAYQHYTERARWCKIEGENNEPVPQS